MTIESSGSWCAPSDFILSALPSSGGVLDLPVFSVERGGIDFNNPRPVVPRPTCDGPHPWVREVSGGQCTCAHCGGAVHVLECLDCGARLDESAPEFAESWAAAPWWYDVDD